MTSPAKPPPKKAGGWGSLLSGAVANLESRLDTILAEDSEASARQRASEAALKEAGRPRTNSGNLAPPAKKAAAGSRDASRTRVNDRLAERLAKATAAKSGGSQASSGVPSRATTPVNDGASLRRSGETRRSGDIARSVPDIEEPVEDAGGKAKTVEPGTNGNAETHNESNTLLISGLPINPAKMSLDSTRPSLDLPPEDVSARTSADLPNGHAAPTTDATALEAEMARMREDYAVAEKQRQEEMRAYLEKIDALQSKLQYLAKETVAAAKAANAEASTGSLEAKLAEKDERIALLMEEGENLSQTELKHLQTIKKLRGKTAEDSQATGEVRKKLERAERAENELRQRLRKAEASERQANAKAQQISQIEKQVEELRVDRENASELIRTLTGQLKEAKDRADRAEREATNKAAEVDRNRIAGLENELKDAQIEKKLAEDRAASEIKKVREEAERQRERFAMREMELKNEMAGLENRVEAMRARAEEASSEGGGGGEGSSVHLLRQVETLQSQYSQAKENWETIEGSLNARVSALERERDEATRREADVRKKARDAGTGKRMAEDELESAREDAREMTQQLEQQRAELDTLRKRVEQAESALSDSKAEFERQRKLWDTELAQRLEEEKAKWQRSSVPASMRTDSPATSSRKVSAADLPGLRNGGGRRPMNRTTSHELAALHTETTRPASRRSSAMPPPFSASYASARHPLDQQQQQQQQRSSEASPAMSRQQSSFSLDNAAGIPPTPSIEVDNDFEEASQSPQLTVNDLMSTSTAGAGPSVQLVERMSAAVRRLESEKATFRDEIARLASQRDSSRDQVVELMRDLDGRRADEGRVGMLEGELRQVRQRYEASLEMLGEREEELQEMREDLGEMKRMYRELVEEKMPAR